MAEAKRIFRLDPVEVSAMMQILRLPPQALAQSIWGWALESDLRKLYWLASSAAFKAAQRHQVYCALVGKRHTLWDRRDFTPVKQAAQDRYWCTVYRSLPLFSAHFPWVSLIEDCLEDNKRELIAILLKLRYIKRTALFDWAVEHNNQEIAYRLCAAGVSGSFENAAGVTPIVLAAARGWWGLVPGIAERLGDTPGDARQCGSVLLHACKAQQWEVAKALLAKNPPLTRRTIPDKNTALHWAAASGNCELCALLIQHGADSVARNANGETPRELAVSNGHTAVVDLFSPRRYCLQLRVCGRDLRTGDLHGLEGESEKHWVRYQRKKVWYFARIRLFNGYTKERKPGEKRVTFAGSPGGS